MDTRRENDSIKSQLKHGGGTVPPIVIKHFF